MSNENEKGSEQADIERYVGISEIVRLLGIPKKTIYKWCSESPVTGFPYYKIGRHNRFKISEVEAYLKKYKSSNK